MISLRVLSGVDVASVPAGDGLRDVFTARGLAIQANAQVDVIPRRNGVVVIAGDIVGRSSAGDAFVDELKLSARMTAADVAAARKRLEGRFVILAADADGTGCLFGDRFAQLDLYVERAGAGAVWATDLGLLPFTRGPIAYDAAAFGHALTVFGWRPPKRHTLYQGVTRLGVGQVARLSSSGARIEETPFAPAPVGDYGPADLDRYAEMFLEAVRERGSSNGNVVYLSSGWDSTAILACLVKLFGREKVRCVIGRMQYSPQSGVINQFEIDRARAVADYFRVPLDIAEFDYRTGGPALFEQVRPLLRRHNMFGVGALNHWTLASHVKRTTGGDEAVFAGEISDGVHNFGFSQFLTIFHPSLEFREYSDKMASYLYGPSFFARVQQNGSIEDLIYRWLRERCGAARFDALAPDPVGRSTQLLASFFLRANRLPLWSVRNSRMLTESGAAHYSSEMERTYLREAAEQVTPKTLYAWLIHLYNSFHWQGSTVATLALTASEHGLRMQLPFWDAELHEFLSAMPETWGRGLDLNPTKYPLKWMLRNKIDYPNHLQVGPHSYTYDVNPKFSLAAETIYRSSFGPYLRDRLGRRPYRTFLSGEMFDLPYIDGIVDRYLRSEDLEGAELNDLTFISWVSAVGCYGVD
jgi:hypothetical protein